ncbi:MFS transporter [Bradyrhizobium sp. U87765 SZCCT0131]|uniref:MFS transporter n=1 Tax=unclassified Bradyrhizobium TaxID=2631580 RepID=UPI001BAA73DF|nr:MULTISPECIES: MFS transporter [unclassified Bradyrhizobium]MBR1216589.1 MFS transporter [Bradyrhizobium sp. U87765 SZCCT0131]MBR1259655.1 MFS transporter [Bradyrhizobium sp. U87765 SZCCT0134]MBR1305796.1 MFS transporter [Bradyrhizobium sp. U87765 SZCCT0110]MBR1322163.1 MFS transporter [Bradyrhizobium sp. U87765 SZCCT0109]MBR1350558.1 MFS transporter [Bradyrhizobium sp. U87765 SZCCT0048]
MLDKPKPQDPAAPTAAAPMSRQSTRIALLVASAFFMEMLDGTVIVTALPEMAHAFGVHPVDLTLGMTAYMLTLAVFIPLSGWFADRFGSRRTFVAALLIFTAASVLCGIAQGEWSFTAARIAQGFGGSMMVPVGRLAVLRTTPKQHLIRAIAFITWPGLIAPIIGPAVGGFLTTYVNWRWIFFLNIPLGLLAAALAWRLIPDSGERQHRALDGTGFVIGAIACLSFAYGVNLFGNVDVPVALASALVAIGIVFGVVTYRHSRRHPTPLLDLSALNIQTYAMSVTGGSVMRALIGTAPFLLPLMFQIGFGLGAFESGLMVLAVFVGNLGIKPLTTPILRTFGFRPVLLGNGLLMALTLVGCAFLTPETPRALLLALLVISGACRSMQFTAIATIAFADVPQDRMSGANTFFSLMFQLSLGMSVAIGAVCLKLASVLLGHPPGSLTLDDFKVAFLLTAVLVIISLYDSVRLPKDAGAAVSRKS